MMRLLSLYLIAALLGAAAAFADVLLHPSAVVVASHILTRGEMNPGQSNAFPIIVVTLSNKSPYCNGFDFLQSPDLSLPFTQFGVYGYFGSNQSYWLVTQASDKYFFKIRSMFEDGKYDDGSDIFLISGSVLPIAYTVPTVNISWGSVRNVTIWTAPFTNQIAWPEPATFDPDQFTNMVIVNLNQPWSPLTNVTGMNVIIPVTSPELFYGTTTDLPPITLTISRIE